MGGGLTAFGVRGAGQQASHNRSRIGNGDSCLRRSSSQQSHQPSKRVAVHISPSRSEEEQRSPYPTRSEEGVSNDQNGSCREGSDETLGGGRGLPYRERGASEV